VLIAIISTPLRRRTQARSLAVIAPKAASAALISGIVFVESSENRIICREAVESGFIALTTCDGSSESARQAEPDDAQMPS
jgi:hypothetical protein